MVTPQSAGTPSQRSYANGRRVSTGKLILALCAGLLAGAITTAVQPTLYQSTVLIRINHQLPLFPANSTPPNDEMVQSQLEIFTKFRFLRSAVLNPNWLDGRPAPGNVDDVATLIPAIQDFARRQSFEHDGRYIRLNFTDSDPKVALKGARAMGSAYQDFLDHALDEPDPRLITLGQEKYHYDHEIDAVREKMAAIAAPYSLEILEARLPIKTADLSRLESTMNDAAAALEIWKGAHSDQATPGPQDPAFEQLNARLDISKKQFNEASVELAATGEKLSQLRALAAQQQQNELHRDAISSRMDELQLSLETYHPFELASVGDLATPLPWTATKMRPSLWIGSATFLASLMGLALVRRRAPATAKLDGAAA